MAVPLSPYISYTTQESQRLYNRTLLQAAEASKGAAVCVLSSRRKQTMSHVLMMCFNTTSGAQYC